MSHRAIRDAGLSGVDRVAIVLLVVGALVGGLAGLLAPSAANAHPNAHSDGTQLVERPADGVRLGTCDMSVAVIRDPAERLRQFVPAEFNLGQSLYMLGDAGSGVIVSWTMRCDRVRVPGREPTAAKLAFVGVQIEAPGRPTSSQTLANDFDVYTLFTHTNRRSVARWLRAGGMPSVLTRGLGIERSSQVEITVPATGSPYSLDLFPFQPDPIGVHQHRNAFWHDDGRGRPARLSLTIPHAQDLFCIGLAGNCGSISASRRSSVGDLLGLRTRPVDFVFDHVDLLGGTFELR